ncbi:hypothetical protein chiPu_0019316 [Chiloscyllium punctatum]|uniref:Uncharacterized protein n=1 Tax=Chiloscyllium punctatum TaxID=137246 RepID=A0A401RRI9_CHIPU|nr:hypothetical protein [Chiloscyllium punctatum]
MLAMASPHSRELGEPELFQLEALGSGFKSQKAFVWDCPPPLSATPWQGIIEPNPSTTAAAAVSAVRDPCNPQ